MDPIERLRRKDRESAGRHQASPSLCWPQHSLTAPCRRGGLRWTRRTRRRVEAFCEPSKPSESTPAACHTPRSGALEVAAIAATIEAVSTSSAASHLTTLKSAADLIIFSASAGATLPPRAESTTADAPFSPSHLPVNRPRPPVPPERRCAPKGAGLMVIGIRTTTLPVLVPPCKLRNAASTFLSTSKVCSGRPCSTLALARAESNCNTEHIHGGEMAMALSRAMTSYWTLDDAAGRREALHTARFPISPRHPPSKSMANDPAMKSPDRLLRIQLSRPVLSSLRAPRIKAVASRELNVRLASPMRWR
eukprot:scaffold27079_cov32-Tisochrysis_lutea.AAC.1